MQCEQFSAKALLGFSNPLAEANGNDISNNHFSFPSHLWGGNCAQSKRL